MLPVPDASREAGARVIPWHGPKNGAGGTGRPEEAGLPPLLDLELRLGEGTGGLLAVPLVQSAARILRDMATFESAGLL